MTAIANKRPSPDFVIRLAGNDIKPWLVPTRTLSRVLAAVQRLVDQRDDLVDADEEEENDTVACSAIRLSDSVPDGGMAEVAACRLRSRAPTIMSSPKGVPTTDTPGLYSTTTASIPRAIANSRSVQIFPRPISRSRPVCFIN